MRNKYVLTPWKIKSNCKCQKLIILYHYYSKQYLKREAKIQIFGIISIHPSTYIEILCNTILVAVEASWRKRSVLGVLFFTELRVLVWIHQLLHLACITQLHLYDPSFFIWARVHLSVQTKSYQQHKQHVSQWIKSILVASEAVLMLDFQKEDSPIQGTRSASHWLQPPYQRRESWYH